MSALNQHQPPTGPHQQAVRGARLRLLSCADTRTRLRPGDEGTVTLVDGTGTIHVRWDNGSQLGLLPGHDRWELLP